MDQGNYNKGVLGGWGVDMRDPSADRRLVEFCLSVPPEQFLAGGVPRSLARRAFADRLPPEVLRERRKGYQAADWFEGMSVSRAFPAQGKRL
jgi:asparagine synthase (glutamine-hydrolysing)